MGLEGKDNDPSGKPDYADLYDLMLNDTGRDRTIDQGTEVKNKKIVSKDQETYVKDEELKSNDQEIDMKNREPLSSDPGSDAKEEETESKDQESQVMEEGPTSNDKEIDMEDGELISSDQETEMKAVDPEIHNQEVGVNEEVYDNSDQETEMKEVEPEIHNQEVRVNEEVYDNSDQGREEKEEETESKDQEIEVKEEGLKSNDQEIDRNEEIPESNQKPKRKGSTRPSKYPILTLEPFTRIPSDKEYRIKLVNLTKILGISILFLLVVTISLVYLLDVDVNAEFGAFGYNISIIRVLRFLWIILFTVFASRIVPIGLVLIIRRFISQLSKMGSGDEGRNGLDGKGRDELVRKERNGLDRKVSDESKPMEIDEQMGGDQVEVEGKRSPTKEKPASGTIGDAEISDDVKQAETFIMNFFKYTILIIGFAYAFLALGLDLDTTVGAMDYEIAVSNILNAILTGLIAGVFIIYFLPILLNIILGSSIRLYAKRHGSEEERVAGLRREIEKIRPGLKKTLVYLVAMLAALAMLNYLESEEGSSDDDTITAQETSDLVQYLEMMEVIDRCLIIIVLALILSSITPIIVYSLASTSENMKDSNIYKAGKYLNYVILIFALFLIMNIIGLDLDASVYMGDNEITLGSIITAIVVIVITQMMAKLIIAMLGDTVLNPEQIDQHAAVVMEKVIYMTIVMFGLAMAMGTLGINLVAIATGLGLLAFAIAFGMQDTIANLMAGIMIAIERPFRIGDRIRVGDEWGDVIDIGMRSTKIRTTKNEVVVVPNNLVATREVWNFTKDTPEIANVIPIGISYDSNWPLAKQIILEVADEHELILPQPKTHIRMVAFGDSSVDLQLWAWIHDARQRDIVTSDVLTRVKERFDEEGIEIPFPHRTIVFKKGNKKELENALAE